LRWSYFQRIDQSCKSEVKEKTPTFTGHESLSKSSLSQPTHAHYKVQQRDATKWNLSIMLGVVICTDSELLVMPPTRNNMGTGNSAVSQPWVPWVQVQFRNSRPFAILQPVTAVSWVLTCCHFTTGHPKSRTQASRLVPILNFGVILLVSASCHIVT